MSDRPSAVPDLVRIRNRLLLQQKELYVSAVQELNMKTRELLTNDFGTTLVRNSARDLAGEVVRRFFDMGDTYITVDQMYDRIVNFSYENDRDLLEGDEAIRKSFYNMNDSAEYSSTLQRISEQSRKAQKQLFMENRSQDKLDARSKRQYRESRMQPDGKLYDELTGREGSVVTVIRNGKPVVTSDLHADHIQARESAKYNSRYIREDRLDELKLSYNSEDNFLLMHASANTSKSDVRVCVIDGKVVNLQSKEMKSRMEKGENITDITHKATPSQLADAIIEQWEKETRSGDKKRVLQEKGYLDEDGKVKPSVRKELEARIRRSQNRESMTILKSTKYGTVAQDAAKETARSVHKIMAGQIIYYVLPPLVFETREILRRKDLTWEGFLTELKRAGARVVHYVKGKLGKMAGGVFQHSLNKFLKTFFDIILELVKATVKKLVKLVKQLVLSFVNCVKIIADKNATAAQKADAVTKTLSVTVTAFVLELLFEDLEKQLQIPGMLMEPLQIIVTVLVTNVIMLVLQKADLFDVQYGLLVANMEKVFDDVHSHYVQESERLMREGTADMDAIMAELEEEVRDIGESIAWADPYRDDLLPSVERINKLFHMGIDFESEWKTFLQPAWRGLP